MTGAMYHDRDSKASVTEPSVTLSGRDLKDALRLLSVITGQQPSTVSFDQQVADPGEGRARPAKEAILAKAKEAYLFRRQRSRFFNFAMFGEPAWDMLLALYLHENFGARQTVSTITDQAGAPATSALRWLNYLEKERLITREQHPTDRRANFVSLTDKARSALESYFETVLAAEV